VTPFLSPTETARLRETLSRSAYTSENVQRLLGETASAALARGDVVPGLRATTGGSDLEILVRLFLLGATVAAADVDLPTPLLSPAPGGVRAAVDLRPYGHDDGDWWVLSDLGSDVRPGALRPDHVLGIGAASVTLAQATVRPPVSAALDLGTGCGIQALHLSQHADRVSATDVNERALAMAATTFALNEVEVELLHGDLAAPVAGQRFDLVVCNPPFVVGPGTTTHSYRDSGRASDGISREVLSLAPELLAPDGWMQLLANWVHVQGEDWVDRVSRWLPGRSDSWVIQRELVDPAQYVQLWLRDAGELSTVDGGNRRAEEWLDWFDREHIDAVGFGLITVRANDTEEPVRRLEDLRQIVDQPLGREVIRWFDRQERLRATPLLDQRLIAHPRLQLRQDALRGATGWEVEVQTLVQDGGLRWDHQVDPIVVALVAGCDGTATVRQQLGVLAAAYDTPVEQLLAAAPLVIGPLVEHGLLEPVVG
jgi:hypothetical protein